jgi:hypothetical protein
MLPVRVWHAISSLMILVSASCADNGADGLNDHPGLSAAASTGGAASEERDGAELASATSTTGLLAAVGTNGLSAKPLPGTSARTVLDDELNEGENLFFTDDGRLFISGAEDIFEIKRAADGKFTKTDHFDEDCIVEGIVRHKNYLYGVCWRLNDLSGRAFLIAGELTERPVFRTIAELDKGTIPNGMTVDPEGRIYVTYSGTDQIARLTLAEPMRLQTAEIWTGSPGANGIKYLDGFMYVTLLNKALVSEFVRIRILPDGRADKPERLYQRALTVLDDIIPFDDGFIITDFLKGTLIFWDESRGVYAETPKQTFFGPTSLVQGRPPMFTERELIVAEKGTFLVRNEKRGDLLSKYLLP